MNMNLKFEQNSNENKEEPKTEQQENQQNQPKKNNLFTGDDLNVYFTFGYVL